MFSLTEQSAVVPQQEQVNMIFDNSSFESLENFLMKEEVDLENIKEEDATIPEENASTEDMHSNSVNVSTKIVNNIMLEL